MKKGISPPVGMTLGEVSFSFPDSIISSLHLNYENLCLGY